MANQHITPRPVFVYVIAPEASSTGPTKIGIAQNPRQRLQTLQNANPTTLAIHKQFSITSVDDAVYVEKEAHRRLQHQVMRGEWFNVSAAKAAYTVAEIISENPHLLSDERKLSHARAEIVHSAHPLASWTPPPATDPPVDSQTLIQTAIADMQERLMVLLLQPHLTPENIRALFPKSIS